jgi:hypothetical protein
MKSASSIGALASMPSGGGVTHVPVLAVIGMTSDDGDVLLLSVVLLPNDVSNVESRSVEYLNNTERSSNVDAADAEPTTTRRVNREE